jgi:formate C-acetyltransferase
MAELRAAMRANFSGEEGERIRTMLLEQAPKYGNDDDRVDSIAREVGQHLAREAQKYTNPRGGQFVAGLYTGTSNTRNGVVCGATPDGRYAGQALADNVSPVQGRDRKGPTATINSVAKLDHLIVPEGTGLTLHFSPAALAGERGTRNLSALVRTHFDKMSMHVQFNVVSAETLRAAQREPEKYRNLVIRVGGFCAQFVYLDRETQDQLIRRTVHTF